MKNSTLPQQLTLFRFPLAYSLSPIIHQAFAAQFDLKITYTQTEANIDEFKDKIASFRLNGGIGANVTMPLKEVAYQLCSHITPRAQIARSVNTLFWQQDTLWGDNTDGIGFMRDVTQNLKQSFQNKTICILGAGGAAAGILQDISTQKPQQIIICNRTISRAEALSARFPELNIRVVSVETLNTLQNLDWIISTIPFSATNLLLPLKSTLFQNTDVYELCYAKAGDVSALAQFAKNSGAKAVYDGLGMLVEQAAESFCVWQNGLFPKTQPVIAELRKTYTMPKSNGARL